MGKLPILYIDDFVLCQSSAINQYIAREYGKSLIINKNILNKSCPDLYGKTTFEMATADMIVGGMLDGLDILNPWWYASPEEKVCFFNHFL
jgi:hypothetical protein